MLEILLQNQNENYQSNRIGRRLRNNDLLGNGSEDESENEGSLENSMERSYERTRGFIVEENELSRS